MDNNKIPNIDIKIIKKVVLVILMLILINFLLIILNLGSSIIYGYK